MQLQGTFGMLHLGKSGSFRHSVWCKEKQLCWIDVHGWGNALDKIFHIAMRHTVVERKNHKGKVNLLNQYENLLFFGPNVKKNCSPPERTIFDILYPRRLSQKRLKMQENAFSKIVLHFLPSSNIHDVKKPLYPSAQY